MEGAGNTWGDTRWGVDLRNGRGEDRLGRILMKVRAEMMDADNAAGRGNNDRGGSDSQTETRHVIAANRRNKCK